MGGQPHEDSCRSPIELRKLSSRQTQHRYTFCGYPDDILFDCTTFIEAALAREL